VNAILVTKSEPFERSVPIFVLELTLAAFPAAGSAVNPAPYPYCHSAFRAIGGSPAVVIDVENKLGPARLDPKPARSLAWSGTVLPSLSARLRDGLLNGAVGLQEPAQFIPEFMPADLSLQTLDYTQPTQ
jgi:hypothetical protein